MRDREGKMKKNEKTRKMREEPGERESASAR